MRLIELKSTLMARTGYISYWTTDLSSSQNADTYGSGIKLLRAHYIGRKLIN